ncbi:profilin-1-like [Acanthochromis polyacanthus]|uniref:profilin-1-like n=1 Tax=Acanthochromis polyacanthus TaxID=80966 RepID=UPI002234B3A8|nr:profilin-1-like [Acanthochromis polyacanthus]
MSWDSYITSLKMPPIEEAAICGHDGQLWATSAGFEIKADEIKKLLGDKSSLYQSGLIISGLKCRFLREIDENGIPIFALKTKVDDAGNSFNICVAKTNQALVIGKGENGATGGQVNDKVVKMAQHLKRANF